MELFPVFLKLQGRLVVVVGGGTVAARKIALLLAAGARVRVVAPELQAELQVLHAAARLEHVAQRFAAEQLAGAMLVVAATDERAVNQAVSEAAAARSLPVNVVDDGANSTFVMPSIIDRSPVVIAIGTEGSSPTLARRLRAQLEAALPARLGELARWLGALRERVRDKFPDIEERRQFWDRLLSSAAASAVLTDRMPEAETLLQAQLTAPSQRRGEVYLIGAGPGDPDLLTLRAQQLLQQADVVLYDRLVNPAVLERVRREAERVFVGKESGQHRITQERIHALMLEYAGRGLRVARLKGGDPFIFGRGGEEIEALSRAGVPFIVVPGVTAALGAAAATALPLTQRGLAQSVTFVTAMGEAAEELDWRAHAAAGQTVVFYMGVAQLPRIIEHLRTHGAPPNRPVAIIERATLPDQRVVAGELHNIVERAQAAGVAAPALLIVGEVATHAVSRNA